MPAFEMKEIRIPSDLVRERRSSLSWLLVKTTFTALLLSIICFFALNVLAISVLATVGALRHRPFDLALAYRAFAAPLAIGIFIVAWLSACIFYRRERRR